MHLYLFFKQKSGACSLILLWTHMIFPKCTMIYLYAFSKPKALYLLMHYQYAFQVWISLIELTLVGDMTLSETLLLEKTSGDKFCPQRSIKVIWTTGYVPLQPLFLVSFIFWCFYSTNLLQSHLWYIHRKTNVNTGTCTEQHNTNNNHNLLTFYTILYRSLDKSYRMLEQRRQQEFSSRKHNFQQQSDLPTDGPLPRAYVTLAVVQAEVWLQITNAVAWQPINAEVARIADTLSFPIPAIY